MREWLETDGLGGFASGTAAGLRTRRYHGLLLTASRPPADRFMLVNGVESWLTLGDETVALSPQRYQQGFVTEAHPSEFSARPWPSWTYRLSDGLAVRFEVFVPYERPAVVLRWFAHRGSVKPRLHVRPLLSGRDPHRLHRENDRFQFGLRVTSDRIEFETYPDVPSVHARSNGIYHHDPVWYRAFEYEAERARGLDHVEDLASPGIFCFDLDRDATLVFSSSPEAYHAGTLARSESARRAGFESRLDRSVSAYVVRRGAGHTVIAGYPWFGDWGRDTFIALRGLTDREVTRSIVLSWADVISEGLLPNRFPDRGEAPEYNSVDASLWYVLAADRVLGEGNFSTWEADRLQTAVENILERYVRGTRYGIRMADDGLLSAGLPGVQLTWMDAKVGGWVVTPRIGKPVEVQALWLNALDVAARRFGRFGNELARGLSRFQARFLDAGRGYLADVVDVDHRAGEIDASLRPNQIFAVGALHRCLVDDTVARRVVDIVEEKLWTPMGLRSLSSDHPDYATRYEGGVIERDGAYHQGTVWPWLLGPFVDAWLRVRGDRAEARAEARRRFVAPLLNHLDEAGLDHVSEIADAEFPHAPRGAPFQAWSVTEIARLVRLLKTPA